MMTWLKITQKLLFIITCLFTSSMAMSSPLQMRVGSVTWQGNTARLSLTLQLKKGWKLYGPARADDTLKHPPEFIWKGQANLRALTAHWPAPQPWKEGPQQGSVYYETIPVTLDLYLNDLKPTSLHLLFKGLTCDAQTCLPLQQPVSFTLTPPEQTWKQALLSWVKLMGLAFLGGLILNVMPCVLPVLGIKLKGISQASPKTFHTVCLYTSMGIMVSFWVFALIAIALKSFFHYEVGWGMQFQNPYFVSGMCLIMVVFALSLLGVFYFETPQWIQSLIPASGRKETHAFFSGVFAALLATPCSAPFLGAALGFALTGGILDIFLIFTCIAVGFALPYLLALLLPIHRFLPRPGPWSVYVERAMGLLFLGTVVWLMATSLAPLLSPTFRWIGWGLLALMVACPLGLKGFWMRYGPAMAAGVLFFALPFLESRPLSARSAVSMQDGRILWTPWSPKTFEKALASGKIIIVDMTAAWCGNCWVNKQRVFMDPAVQTLLTADDILCLRGDLTHGSPEIMHFLKQYHRAAIPFNLVISQAYPQGIVLSEWLSESELRRAITFLRKKPLTSLPPSP